MQLKHFVLVAYALGGACFAILLSGNVDARFCAEHPWVATLLGAGVPAALVAAFCCEVDEGRRTFRGASLACILGLPVAGAAVASFLWVQNEHIRDGLLYGLVPLSAALWRYRGRWHFGHRSGVARPFKE